MADLITTKATFPKSGGLAVADGAVSVNAGNGLHVNPSTGMVEVPVDTTAGLRYGSNGLEVEVDGSTIDFNSSGQMTVLGGGGGLAVFHKELSSSPITAGNWNIRGYGTIQAVYNDNIFILLLLMPINASIAASVQISYNNDYPYYSGSKVVSSVSYDKISYGETKLTPSGTPNSPSNRALDFTADDGVFPEFYPVGAVIGSKE